MFTFFHKGLERNNWKPWQHPNTKSNENINKDIDNNPMQTPMKTSVQKSHILYSIHKRTQNARRGRLRIFGNISVKYNDSSTHKSMAKTTK